MNAQMTNTRVRRLILYWSSRVCAALLALVLTPIVFAWGTRGLAKLWDFCCQNAEATNARGAVEIATGLGMFLGVAAALGVATFAIVAAGEDGIK